MNLIVLVIIGMLFVPFLMGAFFKLVPGGELIFQLAVLGFMGWRVIFLKRNLARFNLPRIRLLDVGYPRLAVAILYPVTVGVAANLAGAMPWLATFGCYGIIYLITADQYIADKISARYNNELEEAAIQKVGLKDDGSNTLKELARRATRDESSARVPERTLHLLGLLGGWPIALVLQLLLEHKTQKPSFRAEFWATVFLNIGGTAAFLLLVYRIVS